MPDPDDTLVTRTWSNPNPGDGDVVRYRTITYDYAGNSQTYTHPGTITYDLLPDSPIISSDTHIDGEWSLDTDPVISISPTPYTNYYCMDTTNTCDPTIAGDGASYSSLPDGEHYFRAQTCNLGVCTAIESFEIFVDSSSVGDPIITSPTHIDDVWTSDDSPEFIITSDTSLSPITNNYCITTGSSCTPSIP